MEQEQFNPSEEQLEEMSTALGLSDEGEDSSEPDPEEKPEETKDTSTEEPDSQDAGTGEEKSSEETNPEPEDSKKEPEGKSKETKESKANAAYAALRSENNKFKNLFKDITKALNLPDDADTDVLAQTIQQAIIETQAKEQKVPVEVLMELKRLKEKSQMFEAKELQIANEKALDKLRTKYNLEHDDIDDFKNELISEHNLDPNLVPIDFEGLYLKYHFEDLKEKMLAEAAQKEEDRKAKVNSHASEPNKDKGSGEVTKEESKIGSVSDFEELMRKRGQ